MAGDHFNAWLYERRKGEKWEQTWQDFRQNRCALHLRLLAVHDEDFLREQQGAPFPTVYHCAWSALEHYLDHAAGMRRELQLSLPAELLSFQGPYTG
jgi:hypothetical protein